MQEYLDLTQKEVAGWMGITQTAPQMGRFRLAADRLISSSSSRFRSIRI
jgi:hypothetical protein